MNTRRTLSAVAIAFFIALSVSYVLCIAGGVLFGWSMYQVWMPLLPGFTWPVSAQGFLIGLMWLLFYSVYIPVLLLLPYNYFVKRYSEDASVR